MAKQILRSSLMLTLLGVAFVLAAVPAHGQGSGRVAADIPFNFIVGDKQLPSGKYIVSEMSGNGDALRINSRDTKSSAIRLSNTIQRAAGKTTAMLVFHRYGDRYFLAEVWGADRYGRQLLKSSGERSVERELASIPSKSDWANDSYERVEVLAIVR